MVAVVQRKAGESGLDNNTLVHSAAIDNMLGTIPGS